MNFNYSFIIPTFNEEYFIKDNIRLVKKIFPKNEIIVADGGSTDRTIKLAEEENVRVIKSVNGRGVQLNEGVKYANGEIFCFLHADTFLPANAKDLLDDFFTKTENKICRMKLGFDVDNWLLKSYSYFSKYDTMFTRFGDMFIAVRKDLFFKTGGFPNWNIFEDVEFLNRASKIAKVNVLDSRVNSSARAFIKYGIIKQQLFNTKLIIKFLIGMRRFISHNKYYNRKQGYENAIIVFARYPTEGKVKTRLASTIGDSFAKVFYRKIAENLFHHVRNVSKTNKYLFYSELNEKDKIIKWVGRKFLFAHQDGESLGERMTNAFKKVFSHGNKRVVIVGSDIPDLSKEILQDAFNQLDNYDIVIGPSVDGGYYLLGMKNFQPEIFKNIEYSKSDVLKKTIEKITSLGLTYSTLISLQDIDTESDLIKWLDQTNSSKLKNEIELMYELNKGRLKPKCAHCPQL